MVKEARRWILHLDMDAFFAAVEQLDNPELVGKAVIIGGAERGVVSTASYEARRYGVRSAMPMFEARRRCPHAVFLRGRMSRYAEKSREFMRVLERFSPLVEKASVDEAYLDASGLERVFGSPRDMAQSLQKAVLEDTGLSCSIGLAPVKFLAKIASDMHKPGGLTILEHEEVPAFLERLPVAKIPGVGPSMLRHLDLLSVRMASDVRCYPREFWSGRMGKAGELLYARAGGEDPRPVDPVSDPKSESAENTFSKNTEDREELSVWLLRQSERVGKSLRKQGLAGRTVTLKLKYADFTQKTRSRTLKEATNLTREIYESALALLDAEKLEAPLRLIGVGLSNFGPVERRLSLLPDPREEERRKLAVLDSILDQVQDRFGRDAVVRGKLFAGAPNTKNPEGARDGPQKAVGAQGLAGLAQSGRQAPPAGGPKIDDGEGEDG
ncbi:DNA polymerase IV [Desulfovibrio sp. OttesenSCG-928-A18]|nr:DNA polymerase IV [Desulfovibrio sp. OttesenSCG-928-A18]